MSAERDFHDRRDMKTSIVTETYYLSFKKRSFCTFKPCIHTDYDEKVRCFKANSRIRRGHSDGIILTLPHTPSILRYLIHNIPLPFTGRVFFRS